jgi:hypothetical protein
LLQKPTEARSRARRNDAGLSGKVWWIDWRHHGVRYRRAVGTNRKEAQKALSRIRGRIAVGEFRPEELKPNVGRG